MGNIRFLKIDLIKRFNGDSKDNRVSNKSCLN